MNNSLELITNHEIQLSNLEILAERFGAFLNALNYFGMDSCPVKGVVVQTYEESLRAEITHGAIKILFQMHYLPMEPRYSGARVSCILLQPMFGMARILIGSFDFDSCGRVTLINFERDRALKLDQVACAIALHFFQIALKLTGETALKKVGLG
jgi:hypothetical protein